MIQCDSMLLLNVIEPEDSEERKRLVEAGLEAGFQGFIVRKDDDFSHLGVFLQYRFDNNEPVDDGVVLRNISNPKDMESVLSLTNVNTIFIKTNDWKIIPLENMVATFNNVKIITFADSPEEAETLLQILGKGVDGVVVNPVDNLSVYSKLLTNKKQLQLVEVVVDDVKTIGLCDRVCVDTCTIMKEGEGMLVGSSCNCLFLVQCECEENGYVGSRPFRVNAGAVHSYIQSTDDNTNYLSELTAGAKVSVCDRYGRIRSETIGRCKIERRPMLLIEASFSGRSYSVILQNAETVRLVTASESISVSELKKGDKVLAYTSDGGMHFGIRLENGGTEL